MKQRIVSFLMDYLKKYNTYSKQDLEKLQYGIEGLYLTLSKFIVIIALAIVLGVFKEVVITLVLFNIIRYTGFGFHAEKSYQCLIVSTIFFILIPIMLLNIQIPRYLHIGICIICIISYILFAPADTVKRPLPNKKKRIIRKICTILIGAIYSLLSLYFYNNYLSALFLSTLIIQAIIIQPIFYKLFKQPYNNYKNYNKVLNA